MNYDLGMVQNASQRQELSLAPQLLQWLRLLQEPSQQLEALVRQELDSNPALEQADDEAADDVDDLDSADLMSEADGEVLDDWGEKFEMLREIGDDWASDTDGGSHQDVATAQERHEYRLASISDQPTLRTAVIRQLAEMGLDEDAKAHAQLVAGALDERGYLSVTLEELEEETDIPLPALESALEAVQSCTPEGIGARDLRECLLLQLPAEDGANALVRRVVTEGLEALAQGQHDAIARHLDVSVEEVHAAVARIRQLNPHPGTLLSAEQPTATVTPDVIIRKNDEGGFAIEVVEWNVPRLRISRTCRELIRRGGLSASEVTYVRSRIRAAMFLLDGLRKRSDTLRRITEHIIRIQYRYLQGDGDGMRPLTMAKVAGLIGVHDTTVSRALADKYVATPVGVFPMRHFFQTGYLCDDGSAMTPEMVQRRIEEVIQQEDPVAPIKDEAIAERLRHEGIPVARRTVAKYRGELGLPSSKERALSHRRLTSFTAPAVRAPAERECVALA